LINLITEKLVNSIFKETIIVLIKWLEVLHSIQTVNILPSVHRFITKLLQNMDSKEKEKEEKEKRHEVAKKSVDLLNTFIKEFD
jgi:hypothetical protein